MNTTLYPLLVAATQAEWSSEDLGLVLLEAVSKHNDVDGVSWCGVAREVASTLGIVLSDAPVSAEARS